MSLLKRLKIRLSRSCLISSDNSVIDKLSPFADKNIVAYQLSPLINFIFYHLWHMFQYFIDSFLHRLTH